MTEKKTEVKNKRIITSIKGDSPKECRKNYVLLTLDEEPGKYEEYRYLYKYEVENYKEYKIILSRRKGIDAVVCLENKNIFLSISNKSKRKLTNPTFKNIQDALKYSKRKYPQEYLKIKKAINDIYNCKECNIIDINAFFKGCDDELYPIQLILLMLKHIFIIEDAKYWAGAGRTLYYNDNLKKMRLV